jgi:hypothetical protein
VEECDAGSSSYLLANNTGVSHSTSTDELANAGERVQEWNARLVPGVYQVHADAASYGEPVIRRLGGDGKTPKTLTFPVDAARVRDAISQCVQKTVKRRKRYLV